MSSAPKAPEADRFMDNTTILIEAIHESVTKLYNEGYKTVNPSIIFIAKCIIGGYNKDYLITGFIKNSHSTCWDSIKSRDEVYFAENSGEIFRYLPMDKVNLFKDLFTTKDRNGNSVVSEELKNEIWDIFDAMIKISIKYVHKNRQPYTDSEENKCYSVEFLPDVDVEYHSSKWGLNLEFPST